MLHPEVVQPDSESPHVMTVVTTVCGVWHLSTTRPRYTKLIALRRPVQKEVNIINITD
jgi:hypothetical protein